MELKKNRENQWNSWFFGKINTITNLCKDKVKKRENTSYQHQGKNKPWRHQKNSKGT